MLTVRAAHQKQPGATSSCRVGANAAVAPACKATVVPPLLASPHHLLAAGPARPAPCRPRNCATSRAMRLPSSALPMKRMDREEFFGKLAPLDEERLRKALWNLYWRGSAGIRERIEAELDPDLRGRRQRPAKKSIDSDWVLCEVRDFVTLARSGAYMAGDRRVSRQERSRWRFTFQRLVADAKGALLSREGLPAGAAALEQLIDLAREAHEYHYFHSEDPVEAARFVVSEAVALLWTRLLDEYGFAGFAERVAAQLIRWESHYGWTRTGFGAISEKETSLARVLASMLGTPDMWVGFVDSYLSALDMTARDDAAKPKRDWPDADWHRDRRTKALSEWHDMLFGKLVGYAVEDRLDRLTRHAALGGPEPTFLQARLAHQRGDVEGARRLVHQSLVKLPGHQLLLDFAIEIGAPLPPRAQQVLKERSLLGGVRPLAGLNPH